LQKCNFNSVTSDGARGESIVTQLATRFRVLVQSIQYRRFTVPGKAVRITESSLPPHLSMTVIDPVLRSSQVTRTRSIPMARAMMRL
jgi:hypothetical protein